MNSIVTTNSSPKIFLSRLDFAGFSDSGAYKIKKTKQGDSRLIDSILCKENGNCVEISINLSISGVIICFIIVTLVAFGTCWALIPDKQIATIVSMCSAPVISIIVTIAMIFMARGAALEELQRLND